MVEAVIAAGMVAVVALVIAYITISSQNHTVAVGGNAQCRERAQYIVSIFKNADNKVALSNWHPSSGGPAITTLPHPERFMYPLYPAVGSVTASNVNTWELIDNGTNWALSLVKTNAGFCNAARGFQTMAAGANTGPGALSFAPGGTLNPPGAKLPNENEYLNIQLYDFSLGRVSGVNGGCPTATQRIIPLGANPNPTPNPAETNVGLQLTATISYTDQDGSLAGCYAQTTVRPEGDNAAPTFIRHPNVPAGGNCELPPDNMCIVNNGGTGTFSGPAPGPSPGSIACSPTTLDFYFAASEAGVLYGCQMYYAPLATGLPAVPNPALWSPCSPPFPIVGAPGGTAVLSNIDTAQTSNTAVKVTTASPLSGVYEFFVTGFDSAGNQSIVGGVRSYAQVTASVDLNTTVSSITSVTINPPHEIAIFNTNDPVDNHFPVPAPFSTTLSPSFGLQLFQCIQTSDVWTTTIVPSAASGAGLVWRMDGVVQAGGSCSPTLPNPLGIADGSHTMTGAPCDQCGTLPAGATVNTVTWFVDAVAAPSPAAYGNSVTGLTAGASSFGNPSPTPSWSLSPAKPGVLPYWYACESQTGTFVASQTLCVPSALTPMPCSAAGSGGFCTTAYDGCGRVQATNPVNYRVLSNLGQPCGNNPCAPGLICGLDAPHFGICVAQVACSADATCGTPSGPGNNICYNAPAGTCHGTGVGPVVGGPIVPSCPNIVDSCGGRLAPVVCGGSPAPLPSPSASPASSPSGSPPASPSPGSSPSPSPAPSPAPLGACTVDGSTGAMTSNTCGTGNWTCTLANNSCTQQGDVCPTTGVAGLICVYISSYSCVCSRSSMSGSMPQSLCVPGGISPDYPYNSYNAGCFLN